MPTVTTKYMGDLRTEITHVQSGSKVITDAPVDNHGKGESISPTDMVAAALGSCTLTIMGISAKNHGFSIEGTTLEITKVMGTEPRRIAEIDIEVNLPSDYSDSHKRIIEAAARSCPVEHSLHPDIKRVINFHYKK